MVWRERPCTSRATTRSCSARSATRRVPPGVLERGLLLKLRFAFDQYVNLRPSRLWPGTTSPLASVKPGEIDLVVVREGTEGLYAGAGGNLHPGTPAEVATEESLNTRHGVERVIRDAFARAAPPRAAQGHPGAQDQRAHPRRRPVGPHLRRGRGRASRTSTTEYQHVDAAAMFLVTQPAALRRGGHRQPLRRHPHRHRRRRHRRHRPGRQRLHQPRAGVPVDVRAGARLGAGHRRPGHRRPGRRVLSAALLLDHLGHPEAARGSTAVAAELAGRTPGAPLRTDEVGDRLAATRPPDRTRRPRLGRTAGRPLTPSRCRAERPFGVSCWHHDGVRPASVVRREVSAMSGGDNARLRDPSESRRRYPPRSGPRCWPTRASAGSSPTTWSPSATPRARAGTTPGSRPARRSRWTRPPRCCTTRRRSSRGSRPTGRPTAASTMFRPDANAAPLPQPRPADGHGRSCPRSCSSTRCDELVDDRPGLDPGRRRGQPLPAAVHVRQRGLPRRQARPRSTSTWSSPRRSAPTSRAASSRSPSGSPATTPAPRPAAPARPSAAATTPRSLVAQAEAIEHGCDQVVFLDAVERRYVDELGGMNVFFVYDDGTLVTPPLTGTILPGITRDVGHHPGRARPGHQVARSGRSASSEWQADAAQRPAARGLRLRHRRGGHPDRHGPRPPTASSSSATAAPGEVTTDLRERWSTSSAAAPPTRTAGSTASCSPSGGLRPVVGARQPS